MTVGDAAHTVLSVLRGAEQWLQRRGVDVPRLSAEMLLGKVLGLGRLQLYLQHDRPLDERERAAMRELTARRGTGEPVAYLLGSWSFRGLELAVGPAVLVPRPETEEVAGEALRRAAEGATVVDLGTGSGAIAIALAVERPDLRVVAIDQSRNALECAQANARRHGVAERIDFRHGSWWQPVRADERFGLVVSNPPYIDPQRPDGLAPDVQAFEPPLALFSAPGDVVSCYREIVAGLPAHLGEGGWVVLETGVGAAGPAHELLAAQPFLGDVGLLPDFAGLDRCLVARCLPAPGAGQAGLPLAT